MKNILTVEEMADADKGAVEIGIPSIVLMERAALSVVDEIFQREYDTSEVLVLCGPGNNGGDGAVIARLLAEKGLSPTLMLFGDPMKYSEQLSLQLKICRFYDIKTVDAYQKGRYSLVIDAVFGIGLHRNISGRIAEIFNSINEERPVVVAVDIASGIEGNTGCIMGTALKADLTVTFAARKIGHCLYPGAEYSGEVTVKDIGIPVQKKRLTCQILNIEETDLCNLPKRDESGNKGTFGKLLVIAGSKDICGAAYLSACAALKCGIGMVRIFTEESNRMPLCVLLPETLITTYREGCFDKAALEEALAWSDGVVIGPGLGMSETSKEILSSFFSVNKLPTVLDADALNIIAENDMSALLSGFPTIITPHMGEMKRLTGVSIEELKKDSIGYASEYAASNNTVCVLKDARTITAYPDGRMFINLSGCSALATAGSGDVLSGILGGYVTRFYKEAGKDLPIEAMGVFVHGKTGEYAAGEKSKSSVTAVDLLTMLEKNNY